MNLLSSMPRHIGIKVRRLYREIIVAFGLDVQIGKKYPPGLWLIRNFLWNTRLADKEKHPLIYRVYKWMDNHITAKVMEEAR